MRYCKQQAIPCDLATKDGYCQITVCTKERYKPRHWHNDHKSGLAEVIKSQKNTSPKNCVNMGIYGHAIFIGDVKGDLKRNNKSRIMYLRKE